MVLRMLSSRRMLTPSGSQRAALPVLTGLKVRRRSAACVCALLVLALGISACGSDSSDSTTTSTLSAVQEANNLVEQGLHAASIGQTQTAIADFQAAISKDPANPLPYYDLGVIYQETLKNPTLAAEYYNKAILADPTDKPAIYNLAILETPRNPGEAINLYYQILKIDPKDADSLFNVGLLLVKNRATAATGRTDLLKAIALDPSLRSRVPKNVKL